MTTAELGGTVHCSAVQCRTIQYNAVQRIEDNTKMQCSALHCNAFECSVIFVRLVSLILACCIRLGVKCLD